MDTKYVIRDTRYKHRGFTLVELLVVIGIAATIALVSILALNPGDMLKRSRDAARVTDIQNLNRAVAFYKAGGGTLSDDYTNVYVSLPDASPTCAGLTLPGLPSGYSYVCRTTAALQKVDGTGWVPINFSGQSGGSPLSSLPIDPANSASGNLFYTYAANSPHWEFTVRLESRKYNKGGEEDKVSKDGGDDPNAYEVGTQLTLDPLAPVGYWAFDEGNGTAAGDSSKNGNNGTLQNSPAWQTEANCKVGKCLNFNGANNYVGMNPSNIFDVQRLTISAWVYSASYNQLGFVFEKGTVNTQYSFFFEGANMCFRTYNSAGTGSDLYKSLTDLGISNGNWHQVVATYDGSNKRIYINSVEKGIIPYSEILKTGLGGPQAIGSFGGGNGYFFNGKIDELRIYNRALSADEIKYYYNISR